MEIALADFDDTIYGCGVAGMINMKALKQENGEVMLEGMIVVILTIFILIWILALGFLHYQRMLLTVATNDAAAKIAFTYNNPASDIVMGYITTEDLSQRSLYRSSASDNLLETNEGRAQSYIQYMLERTNALGTIKSVDAALEYQADNFSASRGHVTVTASCTFNTPFGGALEYFGMDSLVTYSCVARAECSDIANYISTTDFMNTATDFDVSKTVKMINSFFQIYFSHRFEKA